MHAARLVASARLSLRTDSIISCRLQICRLRAYRHRLYTARCPILWCTTMCCCMCTTGSSTLPATRRLRNNINRCRLRDAVTVCLTAFVPDMVHYRTRFRTRSFAAVAARCRIQVDRSIVVLYLDGWCPFTRRTL